MQFPHDDTASLVSFYGDPGPGFESNLTVVVPPWHMTYEGRPVRGVRIHRKCAASLQAVFEDIAAQVGHDYTRLPPGAVAFSGSYNPRTIRGSSRLSCHAFGAAIDMDAEHNPMNYEHSPGTMSSLVINAFKRQGWFWGGDFRSRQDPMHFQAANESISPTEDTFGPEDPAGFTENVLFGENPPQVDTINPQGTLIPVSQDPSATPAPPAWLNRQGSSVSEDPPKPPSMLRSKTGWAAIGLGGSGALDGLQQANEYAAQISMMKWNLQQLNMSDVLRWVLHHPAVLVPVVVVAAAVYVWEDHRKYKRLLHNALLAQRKAG